MAVEFGTCMELSGLTILVQEQTIEAPLGGAHNSGSLSEGPVEALAISNLSGKSFSCPLWSRTLGPMSMNATVPSSVKATERLLWRLLWSSEAKADEVLSTASH